jgi:serine/threonine protein kinase
MPEPTAELDLRGSTIRNLRFAQGDLLGAGRNQIFVYRATEFLNGHPANPGHIADQPNQGTGTLAAESTADANEASGGIPHDRPHPITLRQVAVKVWTVDREDLNKLAANLERCMTEVRALTQLRSEYIVQYSTCFDLVWHRDPQDPGNIREGESPTERTYRSLFVVIELVDGTKLETVNYLVDVAQGNPAVYLTHFRQICCALQIAHRARVFHRDIKPANILLPNSEPDAAAPLTSVKLADFELAVDDTNRAHGSLPYMAPEVMRRDRRIDLARADIYSLGCTFYQLLVGRVPFLASGAELVAAHQSWPRPSAFLDAPMSISPYLGRLVRRMMATDPDDRPSLDEVINELDRELEKPEDRRVRLEGAWSQLELPQLPDCDKSKVKLSPRYRERRGEKVFFFFLKLHPRTDDNLRKLFARLNASFDGVYSIWEVLGHYDYVIRAWVKDPELTVPRILERLHDLRYPGLMYPTLTYWEGEACRYLAHGLRTPELSPDIDDKRATVALLDYQLTGDTDATNWLRQQKIHLPSLPRPADWVHCLCCLREFYEGDNCDHALAILPRVAEALADSLRDRVQSYDVSLYVRNYHHRADYGDPEKSQFLVSYVVPSLAEAVSFPREIRQQIHQCLEQHHFRTETLLCTKHVYVDNDEALIPRGPMGAS